jgi:hypothetical protein
MDETNPLRSKDLIDQSKLLHGRARRRIAEAQKLVPQAKHQWERIAVGRVCVSCKLAQATGEFDDSAPCEQHTS